MSTLVFQFSSTTYKSPLRNQEKGDIWNNISKRHGHLLLLHLLAAKPEMLKMFIFFWTITLAPLFIHIRKIQVGEREIICCCRNVKVTFLALFLGWCHSGNVLKAMIFQRRYFFRRPSLWAILLNVLWSQMKTKLAFFCHVWQYQVRAHFETRVCNFER